MKRYTALLIALVFALAFLSAFGEAEEKTPLGEWYADMGGLVTELEFAEDGAYTLKMPGREAETGAWAYDDGYVILDGKTWKPLNLVNAELLIWTERELFFVREKPWQYAPAEAQAESEKEAYSGYWTCEYVYMAGQTVPASALRDRTDLYIDGEAVALGGERFGDVWWNFTFEDGCLKAELAEGKTLTLTLQQDGYLRLDIGGEEPATLWLCSAAMPGEEETETAK